MILIADSGSTKTKWSLIDGEKIDIHIGFGLNPFYLSKSEFIKELESVKIHFKYPVVQEIYFYGTGVANSEKEVEVRTHLQFTFPEARIVRTFSDVVGAGRALLGTNEGIACILGTGAASAHFKGGIIIDQVPSLGFWLGDEGSGADLGRRLVKAYLRKDLGIELEKHFEKEFGEFDRYYIFDKINSSSTPNRFFASFAPFLKKFEEHLEIKQILDDALDTFVLKNLVKYKIDQQVKIGFIGSVGYHFQDRIKKCLAVYLENEPFFVADPSQGLIDFHVTNVQ
ncbi:MAG: N-acetylglucosamine kinase [Cytophagales bacterium]|nr:N-acetylglucosamine kinase [Cytophagales bacterium]